MVRSAHIARQGTSLNFTKAFITEIDINADLAYGDIGVSITVSS